MVREESRGIREDEGAEREKRRAEGIHWAVGNGSSRDRRN
jgi:hypothetical protein